MSFIPQWGNGTSMSQSCSLRGDTGGRAAAGWGLGHLREQRGRGQQGCQRSMLSEHLQAWGIRACLGASVGALLLVPLPTGPSPGTPEDWT